MRPQGKLSAGAPPKLVQQRVMSVANSYPAPPDQSADTHSHSTGLISAVSVRLAFLQVTHSCHLPKQTPVSCPSVSCRVSPPMYPVRQQPVWGQGRVTHANTHTLIRSVVATLRPFVFDLAEDHSVKPQQFLFCDTETPSPSLPASSVGSYPAAVSNHEPQREMI